jgi:hypothetical protein
MPSQSYLRHFKEGRESVPASSHNSRETESADIFNATESGEAGIQWSIDKELGLKFNRYCRHLHLLNKSFFICAVGTVLS